VLESAPIFRFNDRKAELVDAVVGRVLGQTKDPLLTLNDAAYHETRRLQQSKGRELGEWRTLAASLGRMSDAERRERLRHFAEEYAWDIAGNFDPRVYRFASKAVAPLLGALLSPKETLRNLGASLDLAALDSRIRIEGPREHIQKLCELGTVVFVPTHLSNLDSVVFGFAIERSGFPPATYGAGKNLFSNPVLSFFMHNLGAYRVDRRIRHELYKDILKAYSCSLLERGYHSLFFPGGTRSRSGGVEHHLKLGLVGTAVEAFARTTMAGKPRRMFFVPATINYLITLEAETLIDDFLQEEGKARYLIEDDESTRLARVASFVNKLLGLDGACVVRFSRPLDPFGNFVDDEGDSCDPSGRTIDPVSYILARDGAPIVDAQRDAEYTRELGQAICRAYLRDTVVMPTHLVAASAFRRLKERVGSGDLFAMIRTRDDIAISRAELALDVERLSKEALALQDRGELRVSEKAGRSGAAIVEAALRAFSGYHTEEVLTARGDDLVLADTRLLFYYQNRLAGHGLSENYVRSKALGRGRSQRG
jgi:glycerol-3-phosphate O-acyltransferase